MKILHMSELDSDILNGQMVMVLGWIEDYSPQDDGKAKLFSTETVKTSVCLYLNGCDLSNITEHTLCRVIGKFFSKNDGKIIEVCSLKSVPTWKYFTFSQILEKQRLFLNNCSN